MAGKKFKYSHIHFHGIPLEVNILACVLKEIPTIFSKDEGIKLFQKQE